MLRRATPERLGAFSDGVFAAAALVALKYPIAGLAMCIFCLVLRPEPPWAQAEDSVDAEDS